MSVDSVINRYAKIPIYLSDIFGLGMNSLSKGCLAKHALMCKVKDVLGVVNSGLSQK